MFSLILWTKGKTKTVVKECDLIGAKTTGAMTKVLYGEKMYEGKILKKGDDPAWLNSLKVTKKGEVSMVDVKTTAKSVITAKSKLLNKENKQLILNKEKIHRSINECVLKMPNIYENEIDEQVEEKGDESDDQEREENVFVGSKQNYKKTATRQKLGNVGTVEITKRESDGDIARRGNKNDKKIEKGELQSMKGTVRNKKRSYERIVETEEESDEEESCDDEKITKRGPRNDEKIGKKQTGEENVKKTAMKRKLVDDGMAKTIRKETEENIAKKGKQNDEETGKGQMQSVKGTVRNEKGNYEQIAEIEEKRDEEETSEDEKMVKGGAKNDDKIGRGQLQSMQGPVRKRKENYEKIAETEEDSNEEEDRDEEKIAKRGQNDEKILEKIAEEDSDVEEAEEKLIWSDEEPLEKEKEKYGAKTTERKSDEEEAENKRVYKKQSKNQKKETEPNRSHEGMSMDGMEGMDADIGENSSSRHRRNTDPLLLCREKRDGKVLLRKGFDVWINKTDLDCIKRWRNKPAHLVRQLLLVLVGAENLKNMNALGTKRRDVLVAREKIPEDIFLCVEEYMIKHCSWSLSASEYTRVVNVFCSTLRNPKKTEENDESMSKRAAIQRRREGRERAMAEAAAGRRQK